MGAGAPLIHGGCTRLWPSMKRSEHLMVQLMVPCSALLAAAARMRRGAQSFLGAHGPHSAAARSP
eukprot:1150334-Pelagomonas_calceolata.AAC.7